MKITFCIPSKNNLRYLKSCIKSIKDNSTYDNDIVVWVDLDNDGTIEWLKEQGVSYLVNPKQYPQGIATGYNKCILAAKTELVCMFHADMYMAKGFDVNILKHVKNNVVVAGTRIEPPLHPSGKEKIIKDFGMYPEIFREEDFNKFVEDIKVLEKDKTTEGIFAPWVCYKSDILEIGLHDESFHSYHEDSDIFNRMLLKGMKLVQSRDALVYHLTCRGGQFQDGIEKITDNKEFHLMKENSKRNYLRKWGSWIKNDEYQHPIVSPKYNIAFVVDNCNLMALEALEPWCDKIYVKDLFDYIEREQPNTPIDLSKRVLFYIRKVEADIIVEFDATKLSQESFNLITQLPDILKDSGQVGKFELDIFIITINQLEEHQFELIKPL
jgi:GT2 family glycosyltransferase